MSLAYLNYLLARAVFGLLRTLPYSWSCALVRALAWLIYRLDSKHRQLAYSNIRQALGEHLPHSELDLIASHSLQHFAVALLEMIVAPSKLKKENWSELVDWSEGSSLQSSMDEGRGVILLVPHLGNWEILGRCLGLSGVVFHVLIRPLENPYLAEYLRREREELGSKLYPRRGGFRDLISALESRSFVALFPDQNQRKRGIFVHWFGRKAATDRSPAFLALQFEAPVVVGTLLRVGKFSNFRFELKASRVTFPPKTGDREADLLAYTESIHRVMEELIRQRPEQYFWVHNRYRTRPLEEAQKSEQKL